MKPDLAHERFNGLQKNQTSLKPHQPLADGLCLTTYYLTSGKDIFFGLVFCDDSILQDTTKGREKVDCKMNTHCCFFSAHGLCFHK
jgi:hypothetical protein